MGEELLLRSPLATRRLGRALGALLEPYDFVALRGTLGAGKTLFARAVAEGALVPDEERAGSPTFALANVYRGGRVPLLHLDLYRLSSAAELFAIGFDDLLAEPVAALCEWPERAGDALPRERLDLSFAHAGATSRKLTLDAVGPRSERLRDALLRSLKPRAIRRTKR